MDIKLQDCTLISYDEYMVLESPKFQGQTKVGPDGYYYMVWESEGIYYKTRNKL